jgi:hypothetical protein
VTPRIDLGDLSHLTDEDAELYAALYWERNRVSRGELARVRNTARAARLAAQLDAQLDAWENFTDQVCCTAFPTVGDE